MSIMKHKLTYLLALVFFAFVVTGCGGGAAVQRVAQPGLDPSQHVPQDPELRITTEEVMALFQEVYGDEPLIEEVLQENDRFLIVDSRPAMRYNEGHVPGAIHMPPAAVADNIDKLPAHKKIIFYCGGLHCPLSPAAAENAIEAGFEGEVRVWYEGDPYWVFHGNYLISETPYIKDRVDNIDSLNTVLVDSRPATRFKEAHIPHSIMIPWAQFEQKKGLLPNDKETELIFWCGGHHCTLSHNSAKAALEMGYYDVKVYSAGDPDWSANDYPMWGNDPSGVVDTGPAVQATVSPEEFTKAVEEGSVYVLDVRNDREVSRGAIPGSIHVEDSEFMSNTAAAIAKLPANPTKPLYIHCAAGARASGAYQAIMDSDYENPHGIKFLNNTIQINRAGEFRIN
ncbi:rhodanese-like domain-containing protein [Desulfurispira natronophila]|uniref:Rhodanese-related sulfurtransferase n=1 Tax=Desulfurispira natronophila TaxID=682562 RepID=A0A7W7Y2C7_9BACT|nr:rhodanese-like domain-containing protein [Desulfurispira natronophila]MBB5020811.1 rhodanese-related sulfurtransferase [Desulfurispira natronophila]